MRTFTLLVAVVFLLAVAEAANQEAFEGTWRDERGNSVYICLSGDGRQLNAAYNEFGIAIASIDRDDSESATGNFYEAWFQYSANCPYGQFNWHVNGNNINGRFACFDGLSGGTWNLTKIIPTTRPTDAQCAVVATSGDLAHSFAKENINSLDICITGDEFQGSYDLKGSENGGGYIYGLSHEGGRVIQGAYSYRYQNEDPVVYGGIIGFLNPDGEYVSYLYRAPIIVENIARGNVIHTVEGPLPRISSTRSCQRRSNLRLDRFISNSDPVVRPSSNITSQVVDISSATSVVASVFAVVIAIVALVF